MRAFVVSLALLAAVAAQADYAFLVANTPTGSNNGPYTNGILRYKVNNSGVATAATGISGPTLVDPAGLALSSTGEVFVGDRNGNDVHPGGGSVSRFLYNAGTDSYTANGSFATNTSGIHGINFSPTTGELFAAGVDGPVSRFNGTTPSGSLNSGSARDALISADGKYAYVTQGVTGNLLKFDVASGALLSTYGVSGASQLHWGAWRGSDLYVADYGSGNVYDLTFNAAGDVLTSTVAANSSVSISVGFSPDGNEMYVPGHTSGVISKFARSGSLWAADGTINTGVNMGDIQIVPAPVPEPAPLAALALGLAALARRRKVA